MIRKWHNLSASVKASIAFVFSSFFIKGISFITTPIFTRIMDTTQYGIISTYNAWNLLIEVFAVLGMTSAGIINVGLNDYKDRREHYLSAITGLGNITTLIAFGVIFIVNNSTGNYLVLPNELLLIMFIHFWFYPAQIYWITRQRYELKYKKATVLSIISVVVSQVLAVIAVLYSNENQGTIKLWANELGVLIIAVPLYFSILTKGKHLFDKIIWTQVLGFAIPLIPHYLSQHLMSSADRIMISNMVTTADAGIYNIVYNIGWLTTLVWTAINASLTPFLFEAINNKQYLKIKNITRILMLGFALICIIACILAPEVLKILAPKEYYGGVYGIPPIVCVSFLNALYNLYSGVEFYYKKAKYIAMATFISAIVNVVLNAILIPKYSYIGASYTTLISYIIMVLLHYHGYRTASVERTYDDKYILKLSTVVIIICLLFSLLYSNILVRYSMILVFVIVCVIKRKTILYEIKKLKDSK